jgi:membrane fusion protein (multidrug efflux system)
VVVVTLKSAPLTLTRELSGRVQARLVAEVRPQVGGIVRQRRFAEGSDVQAGQPLYELDDAAYRAQHDSAQAELRKAQASLNYARLVAKRSRELVRMAAVSAQDNDKMIAAEAQAEAELGVAQAAVASSAVSLAHARITAPIAGRIGKSSVTQGALVSADQAMPLATIQQLDPIHLELNQSSAHWLALKQAIDAGRVKADRSGAAVRIVLEDGSAYPHEGKLQFSDVTVDPATGNILLRATVPNPKLVLLPGMFVRAVVSEGAVAQAVLVPQQGVTRNPDGNASALVVGAGGKVESRAVRLSRSVGNQWLVDEGLAAGDRVIVEGVQKAKPGAQVQAVEKDPARVADAGPAVSRR